MRIFLLKRFYVANLKSKKSSVKGYEKYLKFS
jgi:hypothetical protein